MRTPSFALTALTLALSFHTAAHALDLAEAYAKAQTNDPRWSAAFNAYQAEEEGTAISRGGLLPNVVANASTSENSFDGSAGSTDYTATQWAVKATQPLFSVGAWYEHQRAKAVRSQAEAAYRSAEQDLALRVAQAYFAVLSAQETLAYSQSEESAYARQQDQAQQRFDVGLIAITDVLEARASFDGSRANRITAEADLSSALENLAAITGEVPDKLVPLKADAPMIAPAPADPEAWAQLARAKNPDIAAAEKNAAAVKALSTQARAGFMPTVGLFASYSDMKHSMKTAGAPNAFQDGKTTSYGLEANWALLSGGSTYATSKQTSYRAAAAHDQLRATERNVVNSTRTAYANVSAGAYRVDARKQAVISNESALDATQAGYEVGTRNIVDVLLAQRNMYAAKRNYAAARYDYVISSLKLKAASGQLSSVDIKDLNAWLDPAANIVSSPEKPAPLPAGQVLRGPIETPKAKKR